MNSKEIRRIFLDYFAGKGHTIVPSASLVPEKDPTLLFVNAGMVQFKNLFLGIEKRDYHRATTCQKCVRAGGKHNDLDNIGKTLRHHTFFEMLGNFSFGDYFKKEAIAYAWEFLTRVIKLDEEKLWVTVYEEDDDAAAIWESIGVRKERIVRLGEKDNFWSMGDEGPCGPCSEIIYDLGESVGCKRPECRVGCDCDRYLEIWNLVFMEFERTSDGEMKKLPRPSIDTGMGFERVTSVLQGKIGNYETDLFLPLIRKIEDMSRRIYGEDEAVDTAIRVIADHARGATFIINDGVLPGKDGRAYVLRRIIRRALRYGKKIGIEKEFLFGLSGAVVDLMGDVYPDVKNNHPYIARVIRGEEERFMETLNVGMKVYGEIQEEIKKKGERTIPGDLIYKLYDTYGFPLDITQEMAEEDGLTMDMEGFERALEDQKTRSRVGSRLKGETLGVGQISVLKEGITSEFVGYERLGVKDATVLSILKEEKPVQELARGEEGEIFLDTTPFYAESGGQVEDEGLVSWAGGKAIIREVKKVKADLFSHGVTVEEGSLARGQKVNLEVDREKRRSVARNHTATHLLQYALRQVLGDHVKQSGSLVEKDRLRFDFTHFQGLDAFELAKVEDIVNERIMGCDGVATEVRNREEAIKEGATALFEEKYGETVRVVKIGDFSVELCGGTHVRNTGEIGSFYVISEGSLASGVRRIEAATGKGAIRYKRKLDGAIRSIAGSLNVETERVQERVESILGELDRKEKEIERLKEEIILSRVDEAITTAYEKNGVKLISMNVVNGKADDLRKVTDVIRDRVKSCIVVAGSQEEGKGMLVVAVSRDLQATFHAGKIIKALTEKYQGKGGGGAQIAQGGVPGDKIAEVLESARELI
ncbi:MAG TPA: alanine--tRNA ligase [Syntrophorhabdaceae bacterium]